MPGSRLWFWQAHPPLAKLVCALFYSPHGRSPLIPHPVIQFAKLSGFSPIITTASLKHEENLKSLGATHVIDRSLPLSSEIAKITSKPILTIYDAVSDSESQETAYSVLANGGTLILVLPSEVKSPVEGKLITSPPGSFTFPQHRELGLDFYKHIVSLLNDGVFRVRLPSLYPSLHEY